jgi:hypothetical protein
MIAGGHGQAHRALPLNAPTLPPPLITTTASQPFHSVITRQADDVHPPLYFLFLRTFYYLAPTADPEIARIPGIFFSTATTLLLCLLTRRLLAEASPLTHLLPGLLFAVAPTQVFIALEVRGYSLAALLTLTTAYFACLYRIHLSRRFIGLGCVSALAALLTHYFTLFPLLGVLVWLLWCSPRRKSIVLSTLLTAATLVVFWGPTLYHQLVAAGRWDDWISVRPDQSVSSLHVLSRALAIPARLLADPISQSSANVLASSFLFLLAILIALSVSHQRRPVMLPFLVLATTSLGFVTLDLTLFTLHVNFIRYAIPAAPFAALLAACLSLPNARYLPHLVTGSLVVYCLVFFLAPVQPRPDLRSLVHSLASSLDSFARTTPSSNPIVIARPPGPTLEDDPQTLALMLAPYLPSGHPIILLDDATRIPSMRPTLILTAYGILSLPPDSRFIYYDPEIPAHIYLLPSRATGPVKPAFSASPTRYDRPIPPPPNPVPLSP